VSELSDHIDEQALRPAQTSADGVTVTRRSLKELDDHADRERANNALASTNTGFPFRIYQIVPSGGPQ